MRKPGGTYSHKLLHLLPLHAGSEFALFRCVKSVTWVLAVCSEIDPEEQPERKHGRTVKSVQNEVLTLPL